MADDEQYDDVDQYDEEQEVEDDIILEGEQKKDLGRELLRFHPEARRGRLPQTY